MGSKPLRGLFIIGAKELKSNKCTTQGDSVSMIIFDIGVAPLISMLMDLVITSAEDLVGLLAYANDFSAGKLDDLRK